LFKSRISPKDPLGQTTKKNKQSSQQKVLAELNMKKRFRSAQIENLIGISKIDGNKEHLMTFTKIRMLEVPDTEIIQDLAERSSIHKC